MKASVATHLHTHALDSTTFLTTMTAHFDSSWDAPAGEVTDADGRKRMLTGRQMVAHLTALHGYPEARVHFVREQEKALEDAAYLLAALADPRHGAGSLEVRDTIESLTEALNALSMLTPYQQKDGNYAV